MIFRCFGNGSTSSRMQVRKNAAIIYIPFTLFYFTRIFLKYRFLRDTLKGDDFSEMRVELKGVVKNVMGDEYKEN